MTFVNQQEMNLSGPFVSISKAIDKLYFLLNNISPKFVHTGLVY